MSPWESRFRSLRHSLAGLRYKWAATSTAAVYMIFAIAEILIFPLFPAQPKLGRLLSGHSSRPGHSPSSSSRPPSRSICSGKALALEALEGRAGFGLPVYRSADIVEWPFANFLLSKASENRFFGTMYFDYNSRPEAMTLRHFFDPDHGSPSTRVCCAPLSTPRSAHGSA